MWIPVVDGKMPEAIKDCGPGEWEYRTKAGVIQRGGLHITIEAATGINNRFNHATTGEYAFVAVRRIVPAMPRMTEEQFFDSCPRPQDHPAWKETAEQRSAEHLALDEYYQMQDDYAEKQRLTREASTRYYAKMFEKKEPFRPLGEAGIDEAAALACKDHNL